MLLQYDYGRMHAKADELRSNLHSMLEAEDWSGIREIIQIDSDTWSGKAADKYREFSMSALDCKDEEALLRLPEIIDQSADNMQNRERELAASVRRTFGIF